MLPDATAFHLFFSLRVHQLHVRIHLDLLTVKHLVILQTITHKRSSYASLAFGFLASYDLVLRSFAMKTEGGSQRFQIHATRKCLIVNRSEVSYTAPINSRLKVAVRSQTPFEFDRIAVGLHEGPSYPGHSPGIIFLPCFPLNDPRRAARSFFKIARRLFPCPAFFMPVFVSSFFLYSW